MSTGEPKQVTCNYSEKCTYKALGPTCSVCSYTKYCDHQTPSIGKKPLLDINPYPEIKNQEDADKFLKGFKAHAEACDKHNRSLNIYPFNVNWETGFKRS